MNIAPHVRSTRFRAARSSLYVGVALAIGTVAVPSFARTTGSVSGFAGRISPSEMKMQLLRRRLEALGGGQQVADASSPCAALYAEALQNGGFLAADADVDANDGGGERAATRRSPAGYCRHG